MKKILAVLLTLVMLFSLAACGGKTEDEDLPAYSQGLDSEGRYKISALDYVTLPEYKGVVFDDTFWNVADSSIQEQIFSILTDYSTVVQITDRAVEYGDTVNIDYVGKIDGVAFNGGTAGNQSVTAGGDAYVDDFLSQLIGHMPGETFQVYVDYPEEYPSQPELGGRSAVFDVTINCIEDASYPEFDDDFVAKNLQEQYGVKTVKGFEDFIRDRLLTSQRSKLIDSYLSENATVSSVPDLIIDAQAASMKASYQAKADQYGVDLDTLATYYSVSSFDELMLKSESQIYETSKKILIYQAIAEKEGMKVKNVEVADYFERTAGSREYSTVKSTYGMPYLKYVTLIDKVCRFIIDNAVEEK